MENCYTPHYAYLLGLYLGDGHISKYARTHRLRVSLGNAHPDVIDRCVVAMQAVFPENKVGKVKKAGDAVDVSVYSTGLPEIFPQHGPGRKHDRKIALSDWQVGVVSRYREAFIAGLFDADGCEYIQKVKTGGKLYTYSYRSFTNKSLDILGLFNTWSGVPSRLSHRSDGVCVLSITKAGYVEAFDKMISIAYSQVVR